MITPTFAQQVAMESDKVQKQMEQQRVADNDMQISENAALEEKKDGRDGTSGVIQSGGHCAQENNNDKDGKGADKEIEKHSSAAAEGKEDAFQDFLFSLF